MWIDLWLGSFEGWHNELLYGSFEGSFRIAEWPLLLHAVHRTGVRNPLSALETLLTTLHMGTVCARSCTFLPTDVIVCTAKGNRCGTYAPYSRPGLQYSLTVLTIHGVPYA